jgi:membrane protein DedA with SNARE-associated domain
VFDWITRMVEDAGLLGVFLLMVAENVFPPIPSELVMPMAGFVAARGDLTLAGVVLAGTAGSLLGTALWYWLGARLGAAGLKRFAARHGRWLTLTPDEIDVACGWFRRHCGAAVLFGRMAPTVRTLISVPAGVVGMPLPRFLVYTAIGSAVWTAALAGAGFLLEDGYAAVSRYVNPVSNVVFGAIALWYLYRVATFRRRVARPGRRA